MAGINYNIGLNTSLWSRGLRTAGRGITRLGSLVTSSVVRWTAAFTGVTSAIVGIQKAINLGNVARQYQLTGSEIEGLARAAASAGVPMQELTQALDKLGLRDSTDIIRDFSTAIDEAGKNTSGWGDAAIALEKTWRRLKSFATGVGGTMFEGLLMGRDYLSGGSGAVTAGIASRMARRASEAREREALMRRVDRQFAQSARIRDLQASGGNFMTGLTPNQRMGAFTRRPANLLLTVQQHQLEELKKISSAVAPSGGSAPPSPARQYKDQFLFHAGFFGR